MSSINPRKILISSAVYLAPKIFLLNLEAEPYSSTHLNHCLKNSSKMSWRKKSCWKRVHVLHVLPAWAKNPQVSFPRASVFAVRNYLQPIIHPQDILSCSFLTLHAKVWECEYPQCPWEGGSASSGHLCSRFSFPIKLLRFQTTNKALCTLN